MDYDICIIGGGIAGLSAGMTAARLGRSSCVLTGGVPGGELLNIELIDGLPGHEEGIAGFDLCPIAQDQADAAGAEIVMEFAQTLVPEGDGWAITTDSGTTTARAVILAMGAKVAKLGVPGEAEFTGMGVSHCATCDGPLMRGKTAVVAGGGDSGMQEALTLAKHVAKVIIVERGDALSGQASYVEEVEADATIEVMTGQEITAITGDGKVQGVTVKNVADGAETALEAEGVFSFIGLKPELSVAEGLVDLAADGRIAVDGSLRTSARGLFAAGNLRTGNSWRAAGAIGDGVSAAVAASCWLDTGEWC